MYRPLALATLLLTAACASGEAVNDPVFKQGYDMGCSMAHSSREAGSAITAGQPELYRRGFASGFSACGGSRDTGRTVDRDTGPDGRDTR